MFKGARQKDEQEAYEVPFMEIFVRTLSGKTTCIGAKPSDTID
jgi:hypothetical protein